MVSIQDTHDRGVFELSLVTFYLSFLSAIALSKTKVLNLGLPLNRGKDNRETLTGTTKWWPQTLNRGNWSIGVLLTAFY